MNRLKILLFFTVVTITTAAQQPTGFSYQAVLRNSSGQVLANQNVIIKLSLVNASGSTIYYSESHELQTTAQGVVSLTVGGGTVLSGGLDDVPWSTQTIHLHVEVSTDGVNYSDMGSKAVQPVPYTIFSDSSRVSYRSAESTISLFADSAARAGYADSINLRFSRNLVVVGNEPTNPDDPIFEVKNSKGDVLFGVYQEGVRVNIPDSNITKGAKGGFAVGGLTNQTKEGPVEYLRITPDSARIYIKQNTGVKGVKGGFAVGGLTNQTKTVVAQDLLFVHPDSARIYINENPSKGVKGGFAVGGLTNLAKAQSSKLFRLTKDNYLIGYQAGDTITTGIYNSFLGFQTGKSNTIGSWNTFIGYQAGMSNTGSDNTFIGYQAGKAHTTGGGNVYIGSKAGGNASNGVQNIVIGESAGFNTTLGFKNLFIGFMAGYSNTQGYNNIFIGSSSGQNNTTGNRNIFIGDSAGFSNTAGFGNTFFGLKSGFNNTEGYRNLYMGYMSGYHNTNGFDNTFLGDMAGVGNTTGLQNTFVGQAAGATNIDGRENTLLGASAGKGIISGIGNLMVGRFAGYNIEGNNNTFLGTQSGFHLNQDTASYNICIGYASGNGLDNDYYNIYIGQQTGSKPGSQNVIIGHQAGYINQGSGNVFIGYHAALNATNVNNRLYITNNAGDSTITLIYGRFDQQTLTFNAKVGIGTTEPDKQLHVVGDARITGDIYYGIGNDQYTKPDFVFTSDYGSAFNPLEVALFIKKNGHLPWMTKASDEKNGINLTRMQFETVETVENLQLQIIEQQKQINSLKDEIEELKSIIKSLK